MEAFFLLATVLMLAYLTRHYIFAISVLFSGGKRRDRPIRASGFCPTVVVMIPARNEERVIDRILGRMTQLTYPKDKLHIIAIDDASIDKTGSMCDYYAAHHSNVTVLHRDKKIGGHGKPAALNAALKLAHEEILVCLDADYYPQLDLIERLVEPFIDPGVGAVQGRVVVLNEPHNLVTRLVALERIGGYRVDQLARDHLGLIPQFGGSVGAVRRSLLEELGGWDESVLAEDTELTFRLCLNGYRVRYINEAECYEEAVDTWRAYRRQRRRWSLGHMQVAFKYGFDVLKSKKLNSRERIDGLLLLGVYFVPVLSLLSWMAFVTLLVLAPPQTWLNLSWGVVSVSFYSFVGNFAPFFEVGVGAYLDGRTRAQWLISFLFFTFVLNVFICTEAFFNLLVSKILGLESKAWDKTQHGGQGNSYIVI